MYFAGLLVELAQDYFYTEPEQPASYIRKLPIFVFSEKWARARVKEISQIMRYLCPAPKCCWSVAVFLPHYPVRPRDFARNDVKVPAVQIQFKCVPLVATND